MLKLSRHTLFYRDYPKPGEYLAFNTRTQAIMEINQQVKDLIDRAVNNGISLMNDSADVISPSTSFLPKSGDELQQAGNELTGVKGCLVQSRQAELTEEAIFTPEEMDCLNTLKESGILVDAHVDETRVLEHWFNQIKYQGKSLHATILTTYQCNFACTYCFEEWVKQPKSLETETSGHIIEWLKKQVDEKRPESLRLMFYGGEPLMNPKPIAEIAQMLNAWCRIKGVDFSFGIITNGSLIKEPLIDELVKSGLSSVRVTLDGDRAHHDRRRPYLDGRGSFETIIANISSIIDKVKVELGGNFDRDNLDSFSRLLDYLEERGLNKKISRVIFAPVVARLGETQKNVPPPVEMVGCHSLANDLAQEALELRRELIQRGYNVDPAVVVTSCPMAQDNAMVVIDPYGDIYKCPAFVGRPEFSVGHVCQEHYNYRQVEFMTQNPWKQCLDCVYLPMCGGGCRFMAQLKYSDCSKLACDIEYYEKIFPELLKMDYERGAL